MPVRPVVVCEPGRVVIKLNRAAPPPERLVDFESDLRPFSGYEIVAETQRGQVLLCTAGARQQAVDLARSLARALDCEAHVA